MENKHPQNERFEAALTFLSEFISRKVAATILSSNPSTRRRTFLALKKHLPEATYQRILNVAEKLRNGTDVAKVRGRFVSQAIRQWSEQDKAIRLSV